MKNLGVAFAGGHGKRHANDFYPTPPEATWSLVHAEREWIPPKILEPACGDGAISKVLIAAGYRVGSTDLVDRGYGEGERDFFDCDEIADGIGVITNPPFNLAAEFIAHANALVSYSAMLLKVTFWNAAKRMDLFERCPPARIYPLTYRLDFDGRGAPTMDVMWVVWDARRRGERIFQPIQHPFKAVLA